MDLESNKPRARLQSRELHREGSESTAERADVANSEMRSLMISSTNGAHHIDNSTRRGASASSSSSSSSGYYYRILNCVFQRLQRITCGKDRRACISGVDDVLSGQFSAAESVKLCNIQPPQYFWYMVSGSLCDIFQFGLDVFVNRIFHVEDPSTCWALSFSMSIAIRHSFHRYLVFGAYQGGYYRSLGRMYLGYSIIIAISTVFNIYMTKVFLLSHYLAWVITLLWTGIVNYFILKKLWSFNGNKSSSSSNNNNNNKNNSISKNIA